MFNFNFYATAWLEYSHDGIISLRLYNSKERRLEKSSSATARKRGNYNHYSPEIHAKIGKYANGKR